MSIVSAKRMALAAGLVLCAGCIGGGGGTLPPPISVDFVSVAVGDLHACGLAIDGSPLCWGENAASQLATGDLIPRRQPDRVKGTLKFASMDLGAAHTCGLTTAGKAHCWGANNVGQLGVGFATLPAPGPQEVIENRTFSELSAGGFHTCGLQNNGRVYCWGLAEAGQLGNGQTGGQEFRADPDSVLTDSTFVQVSAGGGHSCALTASGVVFCWGAGGDGQLGNAAFSNSAFPVMVSGGLVFNSISAGGAHTCGVTAAGEGYCWGQASVGQLGNGGNSKKAVPQLVLGGKSWATVTAGGAHTCGIVTGGAGHCWGENESGQLGDGTTMLRLAPVAVGGGLSFQTMVPGGSQFQAVTCGLATNGFIYCWGYGGSGQLGNSGLDDRPNPTLVAGQS